MKIQDMKIVLIGNKGEVLRRTTVVVKRKGDSDYSRYLKGLERLERRKNPNVKPIVFC